MRIECKTGRCGLAVLWGLLLLAACHSGSSDEVEVEVRNIAMDQVAGSPVIVLQDKDHRMALPIWIGPSEAQAIALQMEGINPPRPMTHDLMKNVMDKAGVVLDRVVIDSLEQSTYYARLQMHEGDKSLEVDSRPSDAIALAVRFEKPIFVARALLQGNTSIDLRRVEGADTVHIRGLTVQALSADLARYFEVTPGTGVLVAAVGATDAGLQRGDVIVAVNDAAVASLSDFRDKIGALGSDPARLSVRRGGKRLDVTLPADER